MTVAELGRRMSSREFSAWMEYAEIEPFGSPRDDLRAGEVAAVVANVYRNPKVRAEPFTPGDFFPELAPPKPALTEADLRAKLLGWAAKANRRGHRSRKPR